MSYWPEEVVRAKGLVWLAAEGDVAASLTGGAFHSVWTCRTLGRGLAGSGQGIDFSHRAGCPGEMGCSVGRPSDRAGDDRD